MLTEDDVSGFFEITYHTELPPGWNPAVPFFPLTRAYATAANGRFVALDIGGCTAAGSYRILPNDSVVYESEWDAGRADPSVVLMKPDGSGTTRGKVNYGQVTITVMKNGREIVGSGQLNLGPASIDVVIRKIGPLAP